MKTLLLILAVANALFGCLTRIFPDPMQPDLDVKYAVAALMVLLLARFMQHLENATGR
ncbi:hypothetical protein [Burkholderia ubonensis]|uniref:hypothetical protein n=1 Tax=Burkholderia ubonensis TaxID=101571 RepID=UPI000AE638D6|nr:hypothetical protein [Burkholderia ubonensis]